MSSLFLLEKSRLHLAVGFVLLSAGILIVSCDDPSADGPSADGPSTNGAAPSPTAPSGERFDREALLARARSLSEEGLHVAAAKWLDENKGRLAGKEREDLYPIIAECYHDAGVFEKALQNAERALAAGNRSPRVLYVRGDSLRSLRRLGEARTQLEELLRREPGHVRGGRALARVLAQVGDPAAALPLFESYLATLPPDGPPDRAASLDFGRALRAVKKHRRAADVFAELLVANPFDAVAYSELAQTFYRRRMREEGKFIEQIYKAISQGAFEEYVQKGLRESGMTSLALGQMATIQVRQKQFLSAFRSYEKAMRMDDDARLRILYANLCRRFRRPSEGKRVLREALEGETEPASGLWMARALIEFEEEEDPAAGLESCRAGLAALKSEGDLGGPEKGQGIELTFLLGIARGALETGDLEGAGNAVDQARATQPSAWEPDYWRGRVELARARLEPAAQAFSRARTRGGGHFVDLEYWSAVLLERQGDLRGAAEKLQNVLQKSPGHEEAYGLLVGLFERTGDGRGGTLEAGHANILASVRGIEALETTIDRRPLRDLGAEYLALGELHMPLRDPIAFDFFFLASELSPANARALRHLIAGMSRPQDIFVRLQCLHRLLGIEPDLPELLAEIAGIYVRLNVRLDVARELAERLHARAPSEVSYRLLGEVALREGNVDAGRRWLTDGLTEFPGDARLRKALEESR